MRQRALRQAQDRPFKQVDVFTATPCLGNPLAVVLDGSGISTAGMQHFTNWTNLSEATFLLPPEHPEADYKVRIFCPRRELPFAGHPTLGSCHAWMQAGGKPKTQFVVQECGIGLVRPRKARSWAVPGACTWRRSAARSGSAAIRSPASTAT